jgi:hypothetical protein
MDGARGTRKQHNRSDRHKQELEQMKRKGAEGLPAHQRLTAAANEEFTGTVNDLSRHGLERLATRRSGWDPYEVWRTRVKASAKEKRGREPLR